MMHVTLDAPRSAKRLATHVATALMRPLAMDATVHSPTYSSSEQRRLYWRWVIGTLFICDGSHNIRGLTFKSEQVFPEDVKAVREIFDYGDPLQRLFPATDLVSNPEQELPKWVSASHFFLERPDLRSSARTKRRRSKRSAQPLVVRVVGSVADRLGESYWDVLFPSDGIAWVHSRNAKTLDMAPSQGTTSPPSVHISELSEVTKASNLVFLQMIGDRLEDLDVNGSGEVEIDKWCREVFLACPNLRSLWINDGLRYRDLRAIVNLSPEGYCRFQRLRIDHDYAVESDGVFELFEALSDPSHPLAKNLEDLNLYLFVSTGIAEVFAACARQRLRRDRRLQYICFDVIGPGRHFMENIDGETALVRKAPLEFCRKAFVLRAVALSTDSALGRFASGVLANIFEYAAPHHVRQTRCRLLSLWEDDESEQDG